MRKYNYSSLAFFTAFVFVLVVSSIYLALDQQDTTISSNRQQRLHLRGDVFFVNTVYPLASTTSSQQGKTSLFQLSATGGDNSALANISTRELVMNYIVVNPGAYFREVSEDLHLSTGVIQYHIWVLLKDGQIEDYRNGRFKRFFAAGTYGSMDKKVISVLRQETPGKILAILTSNTKGQLSHTMLAKLLGISSQALTWQIGRLKSLGIVESSFIRGEGGGRTYHLASDARICIQNESMVRKYPHLSR